MTDYVAIPAQLQLTRDEILADYRLAYLSRQVSIVGRREVLSGNAKFGIFGDGKELPQLAIAHTFQAGDFRSGYYRDQTFMFATGMSTPQQFFAQLYGHTDISADPLTAGRNMSSHFSTRNLDEQGAWRNLMAQKNSSADLAPTGSQMPRLVGLAYASRLYREMEALKAYPEFSHNGDEVVFGTIGNASTAEGIFWESVNAVGVLQGPAVIAIYDDGYGISVPNEYAMVKQSISELLRGFQRGPGNCSGCMEIFTVHGWDYPNLVETFQRAVDITRREHVPSIIHVIELTQPQGHSTSGSHERYKSQERLDWEKEFDGLTRMRQWIIQQGLAQPTELDKMEAAARQEVESLRKTALEAQRRPILEERRDLGTLLDELAKSSANSKAVEQIKASLMNLQAPLRRDLLSAVHRARLALSGEANPVKPKLAQWKQAYQAASAGRYETYLYSHSPAAALKVPATPVQYLPDSPTIYGFEVLNACFDAALKRDPRVLAFGEDVGRLGDVNQGFRDLQARYGELRVSDTGIREATIVGQAIGLAQRGLRPIAEIQYIDYILYALQIMADDLATLHWRTAGGQKAPVIVRTRGHRLEGVWHSGSPMAALVHLLRGMYIMVPRNMTQAAGFYNTMLLSDDAGLIVEVLNGYRLKERLPANIGEFTLPLGEPEIVRAGSDVTLVTYGACVRIALEAAEQLSQAGIQAEVIDVQTLLPFDLPGKISESLRKTSRVVFIDEDVPGGTTAYMLQEVLEKQGGYTWLDSAPRTISGTQHRPAYGSDGDYFSKPNADQVFDVVYEMMHEANPTRFPSFDS